MSNPRIIIALDYSTLDTTLALTEKLNPQRCRLKIGKELFTHYGPKIVEILINDGFDIFLDLKYHDIPNTVARACKAAADLGIWMINVHALGGRAMMTAAREAINETHDRPLIVAVTLLTSMDQITFKQIGLQGNIENTVLRLANMADDSGLDGVICSGYEATKLRRQHGNNFQLITPCIRPINSNKGDQYRVMTPMQAITAGSNYLVIGRPITKSPDPIYALETIEQSISQY